MRISILVIGVLTVLCFSGCAQNSQGNADRSEPNLPGNQSIAEPPDWTIQVAFSEPVVNGSRDIQGEAVDFTIYIPKDWEVVNMELFEDGHKVAEVLPAQMNDIYIGLTQNEFMVIYTFS